MTKVIMHRTRISFAGGVYIYILIRFRWASQVGFGRRLTFWRVSSSHLMCTAFPSIENRVHVGRSTLTHDRASLFQVMLSKRKLVITLSFEHVCCSGLTHYKASLPRRMLSQLESVSAFTLVRVCFIKTYTWQKALLRK